MNRSSVLKAVLDTNVIVSGLMFNSGPPYEIIQALLDGLFIMVISEALLAEYSNVLARPKFSQRYGTIQENVVAFLALIETQAVKTNPTHPISLRVRDTKDERVIAAALSGEADCLVTGDNDLLVLREEPQLGQLKIVTAREFLDILSVS